MANLELDRGWQWNEITQIDIEGGSKVYDFFRSVFIHGWVSIQYFNTSVQVGLAKMQSLIPPLHLWNFVNSLTPCIFTPP